MKHNEIEMYIKKTKMERKRRELERKRKIENRVFTFLTVILSIIPFIFTLVAKIDYIPLMVFDVLWFNIILIAFIWSK